MLSSSAFGAPGTKVVHLDVVAKRLIGRRCSDHQAWHRREGRSGDLPRTRAAVTYCALLFLAVGSVRGRVGFFVVVAQGRDLLVDTSILHHVFLLLFIVFLCNITLCGAILMPFLS